MLRKRNNGTPVGKVNIEWEELRNRFCLAFFPISRIASLQKEILDFHQDEKETLGTAWARFTQLTHAGPNLSIPDHVLLQHFWLGLNNEATLQLDITTGGSFAYKTVGIWGSKNKKFLPYNPGLLQL